MESPFAVTSQILGEQSNAFDDLRIIARDRKGLSSTDKMLLEAAANELETAHRAHLITHIQLIETQQRLIAVNDQLIAARRDIARLQQTAKPVFPSLSLSYSGLLAPMQIGTPL